MTLRILMLISTPNVKNYISSGTNKDNIPDLYSLLIGILSDAEILIEQII